MLSIFSNMQPQGVQTMVLYSPIDWESFTQGFHKTILNFFVRVAEAVQTVSFVVSLDGKITSLIQKCYCIWTLRIPSLK